MPSALAETFVGSDRWEYLPGRWLNRGDRVRISGGPVYVDAAEVSHKMGDTGLYRFGCAAVDGKGRPYVIVSTVEGAGSYAVPVGKRKRVVDLPGWKWREYRFRKCREK